MTAYAFFLGGAGLPGVYENFAYSDFASTANLNLVSCSTLSNFIYLTTNTNGDVGNAYRTRLTRFDRSFNMLWNFEASGGNGADGYCIQWTKVNDVTGGGGGVVSSIESVQTIFNIRFRTFNGNNIDLYNRNSLQSTTGSAMSFRQNAFYWLDYDHNSRFINLSFSTANSKPATANVSYSSRNFDADTYYLGFGAATGGSNDNHILKSMALQFV